MMCGADARPGFLQPAAKCSGRSAEARYAREYSSLLPFDSMRDATVRIVREFCTPRLHPPGLARKSKVDQHLLQHVKQEAHV